MLLPGTDSFGRCSPGAHYHTPAFYQSSAYLAASLTHSPQVTDSHLAAHTDPVVAFTDDAATTAHSYLHSNVSAFTYRHDDPRHYCHPDRRTDRYAYCYGHSISHRHAHSHRHLASHPYTHGNGHGHLHAFTHLHGLAHRNTYQHSHGYSHGYGYRNQFADRYPHFHAFSYEPTH